MALRSTCGPAAAFLLALSAAEGAPAQTLEPFPHEITLYVGTGPGGGYDLNARVLARHLGRHLPGVPNIVIENMPGEGGVKAANFIYATAPRDGSAFGIVGPTVLLDPLLIGKDAQFDVQRFTWIGSMANEPATCIAGPASQVRSIEQAMQQEMVVGGTGATSLSSFYPRLLNAVIGTRFKVKEGYDGSTNAIAAMEKGEIGGFCGLSWANLKARAGVLGDGRTTVLVQLGLAKHPAHPDIPLAMDYAKTMQDGEVLELAFAPQIFARPFFAPPELPPERAAWLREAFNATVEDEQFLADAAQQSLEPTLVKADQIRYQLTRLYSFPPAVVARARASLDQ